MRLFFKPFGKPLCKPATRPWFLGSFIVLLLAIFQFEPTIQAAPGAFPSNSPFLLNVDLGAGGGRGYSLKSGFAAIGQTTNDFWNFYDRDISAAAYNWRTSETLTNVELSGGQSSPVSISISDAPGAWGDGSSDPMYQTYDYPLDGGNNVVTFSNLPAGTYDLLAYSPDGNFEVTVGGTSYGIKTSEDPTTSGVPVWTEGVQYARWDDVTVGTGQTLVLTVRDGAASGDALLAGIQLQLSPPPVFPSSLINLDLGSDSGQGYSLKSGYAAIGETTNDFWNFYDRVLPSGSWRNSDTLTNVELADGQSSGVSISVSDAPGAWGDGSSDPMYGTYDYPLDGGNNVVTFSNLPAGTYNLLAYSPDGNFEVTVGGTSYGVKTSEDSTASGVPVWTEGVQYARWDNVTVGTGQTLVLTVRNGASSGDALLAGVQLLLLPPPSSPPPLINLDLGAGGGRGYSLKSGSAAVGLGTNDFWNFYDRDISATSYDWRTSETLTNVELADGQPSGVNISVSDAPGAWGDGSSDPMYQTFDYPLDGGNNVVTFSNLPTGTYDVLAYSPDGNFEVTVASTNYGVETSEDPAASGVPVWTEGVQYARWRSVTVQSGQALVLTVSDGALSGTANLSGVQILGSSLAEPQIISEPTNETVTAAGTATFTVAATGLALSYQWNFGGTTITGATNATLILADVQSGGAGAYAVTVSNANGTVQSSNALLTVIGSGSPTNNSLLLNLDLGSDSGQGYSLKKGYAAIGETTNDFWNFYDRVLPSGSWRNSETLTNVELADGQPSAISINVSDAPGAWTDGSSDPMYGTYVYPLDGGNNVVTFSNLPAGTYNLLAYSPDGNFEVTVGGTSYGVKASADPSATIIPVWTEGVQYARWDNVTVGVGQTLALTVRNGALSGNALLAGIQLDVSPPPISPSSLISLDLGSDSGQGYSLKKGYAAIGETTNDFWNFYDRVLPSGSWRSSETLTNVELAGGQPSAVIINVSDAPGAWTDGSSDPMYGTYVYPLDGGNNVVTFSNLPTGIYDVLAYSPDGNFEVTVGGTNYGVKVSADPSATTIPVWTEGVQYARWRSVPVQSGQALVLTVSDGALSGTANLSGVQIVSSSLAGSGITTSNNLNCFSWSQIPAACFVNVPVRVTIHAMNAANGAYTNFNGVVVLSSTNGTPLNPQSPVVFTNGMWAGFVTINQPATNLVLRADDLKGHIGITTLISVSNLPTLELSTSGNSLLIYWPVAASNFTLETSPGLSPPNWVPVIASPLQIGDQYLLSLPMNNQNQFYRLEYVSP